jgi:CO/xanthine dehydrogenase Mo-binding subunit
LNDNHIGYEIDDETTWAPSTATPRVRFWDTAVGLYGIGESSAACSTTVTAPAIYNAIAKWVTDFPTTPEKILKAMGKI